MPRTSPRSRDEVLDAARQVLPGVVEALGAQAQDAYGEFDMGGDGIVDRRRYPPRVVALLRAADRVKQLFPDPSEPDLDDYDAAFDVDELDVTVIGGIRESGLTEEARDHARELTLPLVDRRSTTTEQQAALPRLLEVLRGW